MFNILFCSILGAFCHGNTVQFIGTQQVHTTGTANKTSFILSSTSPSAAPTEVIQQSSVATAIPKPTAKPLTDVSNAYYVFQTDEGGEIVLLQGPTTQCPDDNLGYAQYPSGAVLYGCWSTISDKVHMAYSTGARYVYAFNKFESRFK
jgi:hypothetical protein